MRLNFRQGIVRHQTSNNVQSFLTFNQSGNIDLNAANKDTTITIAHQNSNYSFSESNTVTNAWVGPFSASNDYWLYWDFNRLTFERTFGYTTLEPVAQDVQPGSGDPTVISVVPGTSPGVGAFVVDGYYNLATDRQFVIYDSTDNDGTYTVKQIVYDSNYGRTQITVTENVATPSDSNYGKATLDYDSFGNPFLLEDRHWYDTINHKHMVFDGVRWTEKLRVFAARLINAHSLLPMSINAGSFIGTQIGDTTTAYSGRVVFDESANTIMRDNGSFFTTEDQIFVNSSRLDAVRLESNVSRAQFVGPGSSLAAFSVVAWEQQPSPAIGGKIRVADYNDAGSTVIGMVTEELSLNEVGAVIIQGIVTNPDWTWTTGNSAIQVGAPLWIDNGELVPYDPHTQGNRAGTTIVGIQNGTTDQYFEVAGGYTLGRSQIISVLNNTTNNDGTYNVLSTEYISATTTTKVYVEQPIIDAVTGGQVLMTIGTYPIGQVPVARVLDNDTIVFEQGLGGKGDRGPAGSIENMPPATIATIGAVFLNRPADEDDLPIAVGDNDPRLSDARTPVSHVHAATEINVTPGYGISSLNAQGAFEELGAKKVNLSGGTMTGHLVLYSNPTENLHAAPKQYVDSLVNGLIWLEPICVANIISDTTDTPPVTPVHGDSYIIPPNPQGDWSAIAAGNVVTWNEDTWIDRGSLLSLSASGARLGIALQSTTTPSGTFSGHKNEIAQYTDTGNFDYFETPSQNNAVYVCSDSDIYKFTQMAYTGTSWKIFGGGQVLIPDDSTIKQTINTLSVKPYNEGGEANAKYWQNLVPSDLNTIYSAITHTHNAINLNYTPYTSSVTGLGSISATNIQAAINEVYDEKAPLTPNYALFADLPDPATYNGMIAQVTSENIHYIAQGGSWKTLGVYPLQIPYDISFFLAGQMLFADKATGTFLSPRTITLQSGLPGSLANANIPPDIDVIYKIKTNDGTTVTEVGSITFLAGSKTGSISFPSQVQLTAGMKLEVVTPAALEPAIEDVAITFIGCSTADYCSV